MSAPLRVGVTGGIGSGKSALTDRLAERGIEIVDADVIAREVVEPGSAALAAIAGRYGSDVLQADGALNRAALRKIVFEDPEERRWLEALTHPLIGERIAERLADAASPYVVLVSPLLLEGSQKDFVDHVVVVDVPEDLQVRRTTARDDNPEALVRRIMAAQLERSRRLARADSVVDNSGSLEDLDRQARDLHEKLLGLASQ
jgi:dephospho-CoA kinase